MAGSKLLFRAREFPTDIVIPSEARERSEPRSRGILVLVVQRELQRGKCRMRPCNHLPATVLAFLLLLLPPASAAAPQSREAALEAGVEKVDAALNQLQYSAADKLLEPFLEQARGAGSTAFLLVPLAEKYHAVGKPQQAERILRRVMEELESAGAQAASYVDQPIFLMAEVLTAQKRYGEAEPWYQRYVAIYEAAYKKSGEPPGLVDTNLRAALEFLGGFYMAASRYSDAEPVYQRLLAAAEKGVGANDPSLNYPLSDLAEAVKQQQRYDEAAALYARALALEKDSDRAMVGLAGLHALQGRNQEAEALYKKAIALQERTMGSESMEVGSTLEKYAAFLRSLQRVAEAARLEARLKRIKRIASEPH